MIFDLRTRLGRGSVRRVELARRPRAGGLRRASWLLVVPAAFFLLTLHFIPIVAGGYVAFTDWNGLSTFHWIGLENFRTLIHDPVTRGALVHSVELAGAFFVIVNVLGLALALGLNRTLKTRNVIRSLLFAPAVMSSLSVAFIWQYVFDQSGALNKFLGAVGLQSFQHAWLGDPHWALWTILAVLVWQYTGLVMIIYLAGLQGIPEELIEASAVDGAGMWMRFRRVTFPLLAPAFTISATLTMIFGLRAFEQVLALTGGGPVNASETMATQVWRQAFTFGRFGYGAAIALILTLLMAGVTLTQLVILRGRETQL
ncbi:MAG TPA: sugar ABC transporter permease [Gaiellaceae bacterium]|jgi:raffinose/stachyose/melibiose transport system permease protein